MRRRPTRAERIAREASYRTLAARRGREGGPYRKFRAQILGVRPLVCYRCGGGIDPNLSGNHMMGPTLDHLEPLSLGGAALDPANCRAAHRVCNLRHGNGRRSGIVAQQAKPVADRRW